MLVRVESHPGLVLPLRRRDSTDPNPIECRWVDGTLELSLPCLPTGPSWSVLDVTDLGSPKQQRSGIGSVLCEGLQPLPRDVQPKPRRIARHQPPILGQGLTWQTPTLLQRHTGRRTDKTL
jgi:hypothetical protein